MLLNRGRFHDITFFLFTNHRIQGLVQATQEATVQENIFEPLEYTDTSLWRFTD